MCGGPRCISGCEAQHTADDLQDTRPPPQRADLLNNLEPIPQSFCVAPTQRTLEQRRAKTNSGTALYLGQLQIGRTGLSEISKSFEMVGASAQIFELSEKSLS